jgi:hypothetical protein
MVEQGIKCRRCGGMMIETYSDLLSPSEKGKDEFGWRCISCGDYIDRQVIANRAHEPYSEPGYHRHGYALDDWREADREILSRPRP